MERLPRKRKKALKKICKKNDINFKSFLYTILSWKRMYKFGKEYQIKLYKYYGFL